MRAINKLSLYLFFIGFACLSACTQKNQTSNKYLDRQFAVADSLVMAGDGWKAITMLQKLRPQIPADNPILSTYYCLQSEKFRYDKRKMELYADSALAFFSNPNRVDKYPNEYYSAMISKGNAGMATHQYNTALKYYDRAKDNLANVSIDNGSLSSNIAAIYYNQKNYLQAARYLRLGYQQLIIAKNGFSNSKQFFTEQGLLNNIGNAYEKAGMLDSADYYYQLDLKHINQGDKNYTISNEGSINAARIVLYDNLGGLNIKRGKLTEANDYLEKCLAIPYQDIDGIHIPPYIKLAELSLLTGDYARAEMAFGKSRALLNMFSGDNIYSEVLWNKLYAQYLSKMNKPADAYNYLNRYIRLNDSIENSSTVLYRLNVTHEFNLIHQRQALSDLAQKNKVKMISLVCISLTAILFILLILVIYRNLKGSRQNQRDITLQNHQLQQTLGELEDLNKNYIRVMRVMAHDLRNPLSGMMGLSTVMLADGGLSDENQRMLELIETTGAHAIGMINELLKTGLADEHEKVPTELVDLKALLFDSVELLQFKASEKHQHIILDSPDAPVMANVNHEKMWRVFNNLIVNAIKFSYEHSEIKVSIRTETSRILVSVADNGMGIPDAHKNSVFEMFTPSKKAGTAGEQPFGLGLSISKRIVEMHSGKIWFESAVDAGTTFYIELPTNSN